MKKSLPEFKTKSKEDLKELLNERTSKLQGLKFDVAFNRLKDISSIKKTRREIAQIKTLLNQK